MDEQGDSVETVRARAVRAIQWILTFILAGGILISAVQVGLNWR
jgi:hypothetical protein